MPFPIFFANFVVKNFHGNYYHGTTVIGTMVIITMNIFGRQIKNTCLSVIIVKGIFFNFHENEKNYLTKLKLGRYSQF